MSETPSNSRAHLHYVCDMLDQLKAIASTNGHPFLGYLIDMAHQEAAKELQRIQGGAGSKRQGHPSV